MTACAGKSVCGAAGVRFGHLAGAAALLLTASWAGAADRHVEARSEYRAPRAVTAPLIDGQADDASWAAAGWRAIDQRWLGPEHADDDFQGRFKVVWTPERIYLLVEIVDDILYDRHRDPLVQYWDDDCLEIFLDEDFSGGDHQYNHNAFAYHMSLDNQAIDIGTDRAARSYPGHVESRWRQQGRKVVWELAIDVYPDSYRDDATDNRPVQLSAGKILGLMLAYCDNDGSELRESFVGSEPVPSGKKDRGWIDANLFGKLVLDAAP
jgi:Carbohydrate family 9 binding domain-like